MLWLRLIATAQFVLGSELLIDLEIFWTIIVAEECGIGGYGIAFLNNKLN